MSNWTPEMLNLMITKMMDRKLREIEVIHNTKDDKTVYGVDNIVTDTNLFDMLGDKLQVIKRG